MSKQFSIVGCQHGHIGVFIKEMLEKGYSCAGIYDPGEQTFVNRFSKRFNIPVIQDEEVLFAPSVQIVGSSAINDKKIEIIEKCEKHGKHVIIDKPAITNREGNDRLEAVMSRNDIQIGMMLPKRFNKNLVAIKQQIDRGHLGEIVNISIRSPHILNKTSRAAWHFSKEKNGGIIHDLLIHDFDLIRWLTGKEIGTIQSLMTKNFLPEYPDFYDTVTTQLLLGEKTTVQLYADWHTPAKSTNSRHSSVHIVGTKGAIEYGIRYNPVAEQDEPKLWLSNDEHAYLELQPVPESLTPTHDFIERIQGRTGTFTHQDILAACLAAVEADEQAICLD